MLTRSILLFISTGLFCGATFAQTPFPAVRHYVAPVYPHVARAVRATGLVNVNVEVDDKGNVISASAFSRHRLLRRSAETAAAQWTFSSIPGRHFLVLRFIYKLGYAETDKSALTGPYEFEVAPPEGQILQTIDHSAADSNK